MDQKLQEEALRCGICPHSCSILPGNIGLCKARENKNGTICCTNYGRLTSLALDPIEKKPLRNFHPGSFILSCGSYGCNFRCDFCQNHGISMTGSSADTIFLSPSGLVSKAEELKASGNIGIAFTYNEPLIGYEYVYDTAKLSADRGLANVLVTNGYINQKPLEELLPFIHAMNIDLKGFSEGFYKEVQGDLETVKQTIKLASAQCHVEVTTLIIPGRNDSIDEMKRETEWLASVGPDIPLHISRFFPNYLCANLPPTPLATMEALIQTAKEQLNYVYGGNF